MGSVVVVAMEPVRSHVSDLFQGIEDVWIISEEISISMLTKPNTQMPIGIRLREDVLSFMVGILSVVVTVRHSVSAKS